MSTQTTPVIEMFEHVMDLAAGKAAEKKTSVTLVVAPTTVVFDLMQSLLAQNGQEPFPAGTEQFALALYRGAVVFGVQTVETHRYHGILSCWDSDQLRPDIATCPQLVGTERPSEHFDLFGHTLWGCQVEDWMAEYHAGIQYLLNSKTEQPLVTAKLIP